MGNTFDKRMSFLPSMATNWRTAFVKCSHRFIGGSRLNLHKVCATVAALWARFCRRVNVFPGRRPPKNIINFFKFRVFAVTYFARNVANVRASVARKTVAFRAFFDNQYIRTSRAKEQHISIYSF